MEIEELQKQIDALKKENAELKASTLIFNSQVQSLTRMATRLKKLCKRLEPTTEIVQEMQQIAAEIKSSALIISEK